jgi:hypothetical protein
MPASTLATARASASHLVATTAAASLPQAALPWARRPQLVAGWEPALELRLEAGGDWIEAYVDMVHGEDQYTLSLDVELEMEAEAEDGQQQGEAGQQAPGVAAEDAAACGSAGEQRVGLAANSGAATGADEETGAEAACMPQLRVHILSDCALEVLDSDGGGGGPDTTREWRAPAATAEQMFERGLLRHAEKKPEVLLQGRELPSAAEMAAQATRLLEATLRRAVERAKAAGTYEVTVDMANDALDEVEREFGLPPRSNKRRQPSPPAP